MRLEQRRTRDLRQWPRFPAPGSKPIKADLGPAGAGTLLDISSGGVRVQSIAPLRRGVELPIRIYLPQCAEVIQSSGKVVWSQSSALAGIRFGILTQAQNQALDHWLAAVARSPDGEVKEEKSFFGLLIEMQERNLSYSEALRFIARRVIDLTPATGASISLGSREDTVRMVSVGQAPPYGVRISTNDGILGDCSRRRKVIHIQNAEVDPRIAPIKKGFKFGSAVVLPLSIHGEVRGFLEAFSNTPYAFNAKSIEVLERLADATVIVEQEFTPSSIEASISEAGSGSASPISVSVAADLPAATSRSVALPESELPVFAAEITDLHQPELARRLEPEISPANLDTVTLFKTIRAAAPSLVLPSSVVDAIIEAKERAERDEDEKPADFGLEAQPDPEASIDAQQPEIEDQNEVPDELAALQQEIPNLEDGDGQVLPAIEGPVEQALPEIDSFIEKLVAELEQVPKEFQPIEPTPVLPNLTVAGETVAAFEAEAEAAIVSQPAATLVMAGSMFPSLPAMEKARTAPEQSDVTTSIQNTSSRLVVLPKPTFSPDQGPRLSFSSDLLSRPQTKWIVASAAALIFVLGGFYFWNSNPIQNPTAATPPKTAPRVASPLPSAESSIPATPAVIPVSISPKPQTVQARPQLTADRLSPVEVALPIILPAAAPKHRNGSDAPTPPLTQIASDSSGSMLNIIPDTTSVPELVRQSKPPVGGVLIRKITPVFPPMARQMKVDGEVELKVRVGKDGKVLSVERISGLAILANAAADAVKGWRYTPTIIDGHPVEVDKTVVLNFKR